MSIAGTSTESVTPEEPSGPLWRTILVYLLEVPSLVVIMVCAYVGLILYFFVAMLILYTLLVSLFSYSLAMWPDLTMHILIWITWLPLFELLLSLCLESMASFFLHIRDFLSLSPLHNYVSRLVEEWNQSRKARFWAWLKFVLFCLIVIASILAIIQGIFLSSTPFLYILCGYSAIPPILAFLRVLGSPWYFIFRARQPELSSRLSAEPLVESADDSLPKILDPFDPSQITKQTAWLDFLDSDWCVLSRLRERRFVHVIAPLILLGLTIALIVFDVKRDQNVRDADAVVQKQMNFTLDVSASLLRLFFQVDVETDIVVDLLPKTIAVIELTVRIVFQIFILPFLAFSNVTILFWGWSSLKQRHRWIFRVKIVGLVFFILCGVALGGGFLLRSQFSIWKLPSDFAYSRPSFRPVSQSARAPICNASVGNVGILELAALPMIIQSADFSGLQGSGGWTQPAPASQVWSIPRALFASVFTDGSFIQTPMPSPPPDRGEASMCDSEENTCIYLFGRTNCSDIPDFWAIRPTWCGDFGLCGHLDRVLKSPLGFCDFSIERGIVRRSLCAPLGTNFARFACSGRTSFCHNWTTDDVILSAICGPFGLCKSFNFTERCDPFDRSSFIFRYDYQVATQFMTTDFGQSYLMVASGFLSPQDVGLAVENVGTVWFHFAVRIIIPFYHIFSEILLKPVMGRLGQTMIELVFGPNRMPLRFAQEAAALCAIANVTSLLYEKSLGFSSRGVLIGHSHWGLIIRAIAMKDGIYGVSFEGSQYDLSPLQGFFGHPNPSTGHALINEASGASLFAMDDEMSKWNYRMPDWQKWWKPSNPYETFCLLAAGCTMDDRYDALCNASVGQSRFKEYFESWNRERIG